MLNVFVIIAIILLKNKVFECFICFNIIKYPDTVDSNCLTDHDLYFFLLMIKIKFYNLFSMMNFIKVFSANEPANFHCNMTRWPCMPTLLVMPWHASAWWQALSRSCVHALSRSVVHALSRSGVHALSVSGMQALIVHELRARIVQEWRARIVEHGTSSQ